MYLSELEEKFNEIVLAIKGGDSASEAIESTEIIDALVDIVNGDEVVYQDD